MAAQNVQPLSPIVARLPVVVSTTPAYSGEHHALCCSRELIDSNVSVEHGYKKPLLRAHKAGGIPPYNE